MKKDIYPDVRIEIISEGLTKKILESSGSPAPSVYGEEQPEGKNLPNVGIKGKNKELQSLLETSNKKPNYTGLVKEAIQELRKDNQNKYAVGSDKPELTAAPQGFERGPEFKPKRTRKDTPTIYRGTGFRGRETDAPLMDEERPYMGGGDTPTTQSPSEIAQRGSEAGPTVTPYSASDVLPRKKLDARTSAIASEVASQTQNMVKEAIFELRKQPEGIPDMERRLGGKTRGAGIGPVPESIGATSATSAEIQSAPRTQTVQRDVRINEPQDKKPGNLGLAGDIAVFGDKYGPVQERGVLGMPNIDEVSPGMPGAGGIDRKVGFGSAVESSGLEMETEDAKAARQAQAERERKGIKEPKGFATEDIDYGVGATATGAGMKETEKEPVVEEIEEENIVSTNETGDTELQADPGTGGTGGTGDVDATASEIATNVTGIEPEEEEEESSTPEIDPKVTSELGLGVRANPELTRPKNSKGDLLPQFGSSGYFDAIVSIGEGGKNVEANYGVSNLSDFLSLYAQNPQFDQTKFETNFKIEQKADIEKANPFKASLKKQAPPMAMTMNRPPNMGVGQQQPVVTGAGTMKNTEKAVAANKPAATPAKTKARRRKPKTIEMMVKSIANRVG